MKEPDKRKFVNWEEKSGNDDERISKRLDGRALLSSEATTQNDAKPKATPPNPIGTPPQKVRKNIKEVYDEEDEDEEDSAFIPYFNISLIEDDEHELKKDQKKEQETLSIAKEQELVSKLNMIMNTAIDAQELGLSSKLTQKDFNRINNAEYNPSELKRKTIKEKIEKPLGLKGDVSQSDLDPTLESLKTLIKDLPADSLDGVSLKDMPEIEQAPNQEEMAKLILKKSGRIKSKKSISEIMAECEEIKKALGSTNEKE